MTIKQTADGGSARSAGPGRAAGGKILLTLAWLGWALGALAQDTPQISISGGNIQRIPYDPPNEHRIKFEISITEGAPNGSGKDLMKGVKIKEFPVTGGPAQMIAEAPECLYDPKSKEFSSAGPLQVHAQDGKFFVQGTGFLFRQNDSSLVISNDAHSIIQNQTGTNALVATEISSRRAYFQMKTEAANGSAVYEQDVQVKDPRMRLTCDYLYAELPRGKGEQTNRLNHIVAETNVVMDFTGEHGERSHATAEKAVYNYKKADAATNEVLELTGNPRVELTNGWMTADLFVVDRATGSLEGQDNFHFHYLPESPGGNAAKTNVDEADIYSDLFKYDQSTRVAQFSSVWSHVRVRSARLKLDCESLTTTLPHGESGQDNQLNHILAEKEVTLDFPDEKSGQNVHATGQRAVYDYTVVNSVTNKVLELTGKPTLEMSKPVARLTADAIKLDQAAGKIWAAGNQHSVFKKLPDEPETMDTDVFSDRFESTLDTGVSVYDGGVRAYDPDMNLTSERLTIKTVKGEHGQSNRLDNIVAEGDVVIDFVDKAFVPGDITNLTALAARLNLPQFDDGVALYVREQLAAPTLELVKHDEGGTNAALRAGLVADLNRLTQSGALYETNRFAKVELSPDTTAMLRQRPLGIDLVALNRLLLLDAFRGEIARTEWGERTHATADRAMYAYVPMGATTNAVLNLTGHPSLAKPDGVVTADEVISYDRTTGDYYALGRPHGVFKFGGLTGIKAPGMRNKSETKP